MLPRLSFSPSLSPKRCLSLHSGRLLREHGRMVVSMPAGAPPPFLPETGGVALGSGHHFRPVPARTRRITYAAHPECLAGYMIRRKTCGSNYRHCWPA